MKNLNLVELNAQELREVEGGFILGFALAASYAAVGTIGIFALGVYNGYHSAAK